jgi:DEAD/DEAH box helicase domain-containing protein
MSHPIIFDIETQFSFQEVGYDHKKLKISVVGIYDYGTDEYRTYREDELRELVPRFERASYLVGFNINKFDLPVLAPYYLGNYKQFTTIDMLEEVEKSLGHRIALDDLARATLGIKKSGHGLLAIEYFKNGEWEKLSEYCLDDVKITRELFEYGQKHGKLFFTDTRGKREIPVTFGHIDKPYSVSLSLPL